MRTKSTSPQPPDSAAPHGDRTKPTTRGHPQAIATKGGPPTEQIRDQPSPPIQQRFKAIARKPTPAGNSNVGKTTNATAQQLKGRRSPESAAPHNVDSRASLLRCTHSSANTEAHLESVLRF